MSEYPNYTLTELAELILKLDEREGLSQASLGTLKDFAKAALENKDAVQRANFPTIDRALRSGLGNLFITDH